MTFTPSIQMSEAETLRIRALAERWCGERRIGPFIREVGRALRRSAKGRKVKVIDFTTPADRCVPRIQLGITVDGRPDHGLIFGLIGAREGASQDN